MTKQELTKNQKINLILFECERVNIDPDFEQGYIQIKKDWLRKLLKEVL